MAASHRRILASLALAGIGGGAAVALGWGVASHVKLTGLRVSVADACARVEAAHRSRIELVANLVHSSEVFECLPLDRRAELAAAIERASSAHVFPGLALAPKRYAEFVADQRSLSEALGEFWAELEAKRGSGPRIVSADLATSLERAESLLETSFVRLDESLAAYRAVSERFPGYFMARDPEASPLADPAAVAGGDADEAGTRYTGARLASSTDAPVD